MPKTLTAKQTEPVRARGVRFAGEHLLVKLSAGRELSVPYKKIPRQSVNPGLLSRD